MKKIFTFLSLAAAFAVNAQTNLMSNGDLETWTDPAAKPDGWFGMSAGSGKETTNVHGGLNSAKIVPIAGSTPGNFSNGNLDYPDVAASENTQYTVAYWILDNDADARSRHWIQFRTASANISITGNTAAQPFQPTTYTSDSGVWVRVVATATTPAGTTILRPSFRTYAMNSVGTGVNYWDDFQLVQGTLAVTDVATFDRQVKMNTLVGDQLTLRLPERSTVNIYSVDGKVVSSSRVSDGDSVDASHLAKGNYIVTVDNGSAKVSRKIIKK